MKRTCGPCTVCCTLQGVKTGLPPDGTGEKRPGTPCPHCDKGCTIYQDRPGECRDFECLWLQGFGELWDRPDLLGVMFEYQDKVSTPFFLARTLGRNRVNTRVRDLARTLRERTGRDVAAFHPDQETGEWYRELELEILE